MVKKKKTLGFAFSDQVSKVTYKNPKFKKVMQENWKDSLLPKFEGTDSKENKPEGLWLQTLFYVVTLGAFFLIFLKLFHLQVALGKVNRELADSNRIQVKIIHAPRGVIFDKNGKILAANAPAFRLTDPKQKTSRLITREEALELEVGNDPLGRSLEVDNVRTYPMGEVTAHLVGYVGEVSLQQLKEDRFKNYRLGDFVGQSGIEAQYEKILKGVDGGEIIEVDSQGRQIRQLRIDPPIPGKNLYLNIDSGLQQKLYDAMKDALGKTGSCCGAAVAGDPFNGQILALVSFPTFDPNIFTRSGDNNAIAEIFARSDSPSMNRVIGGTYPPGSTFKIVTSIAALGSSKITPHTIFIDNGVMNLGIYTFSNWYFNQYGRTEGPVDLIKALKRSNDTYFYYVGQTIGEKVLGEWAKKLNFGKVLGIDLPGEVEGLVPDDEWKRKTFNQVWYPGDTLHMAIGQGFVLTTPLQILGVTSLVASNGTFYRPQLMNKITAGDTTLSEFKPQVLSSNLVNSQDLEVIKTGLEEVPKDGGTAWPFFTFPIPTAGKTGTAEFGDPKNKTHAWYTSYAPSADPKIALTVLIEAGGEGSNETAAVAKEVYRWYFSPNKNNLIKDLYSVATSSAKQFGE